MKNLMTVVVAVVIMALAGQAWAGPAAQLGTAVGMNSQEASEFNTTLHRVQADEMPDVFKGCPEINKIFIDRPSLERAVEAAQACLARKFQPHDDWFAIVVAKGPGRSTPAKK